MIKISFALDIANDWPPVGSESVWCDEIDGGYKLLNAPFFINGLAAGDVFSAEIDKVNQHVFDFTVIKHSVHSLVWLMNMSESNLDSGLAELRQIGCNTEGFSKFDLYSVDVPPTVELSKLDKILSHLENQEVAVAYPVWRFEE